MSTHTNTIRPENKIDHTTRNTLLIIITVLLVLVAAIAITSVVTSQPVAGTSPEVAYSNALEMQYAQPWLATENEAVVYSNALEMQYAQSWIEDQNRLVTSFSNALELQYAQPWLEEAGLLIPVTGAENASDCHSSLEMFYACQYGNVRP